MFCNKNNEIHANLKRNYNTIKISYIIIKNNNFEKKPSYHNKESKYKNLYSVKLAMIFVNVHKVLLSLF